MTTTPTTATFDKILAAATQLFAARGYRAASVALIAQAAGIAEGTIYNHFDNKEDLLVRVFERGMGRYVQYVEARLGHGGSPVDWLERLVAAHLSYLGQHRDTALVTQVALRQPDRDLQRTLSDFLRPYFDLIDHIISSGQEQGLFSPTIDRHAARSLIFGSLDQTVTAWVLSEFSYDLESMTPSLVNLLTAALTHAGPGQRCTTHTAPLATGDGVEQDHIQKEVSQ